MSDVYLRKSPMRQLVLERARRGALETRRDGRTYYRDETGHLVAPTYDHDVILPESFAIAVGDLLYNEALRQERSAIPTRLLITPYGKDLLERWQDAPQPDRAKARQP